jgi:rod shape-determining protein MreC
MSFEYSIFKKKITKLLFLIFGLGMMLSGFVLFFRTFPNNSVSVVFDALFLRTCEAYSWVEDSIKGLYKEISIAREAREEISELKSEIAKLRDITIDYYETKRENASLLKYYDIKKENPHIKFASASVIGHFGKSIFINSGSLDGISKNDAVITSNGIVGRVSQVHASTSVIKTILASDVSMSAVNSRNGASGVISGNNLFSNSEFTNFTLISSLNAVAEGDILTTSGLSGIYPKGLKIGVVKSVKYENSGYYAVVEPFEKIKEIKSVFIITDFIGKGKVNLQNGRN